MLGMSEDSADSQAPPINGAPVKHVEGAHDDVPILDEGGHCTLNVPFVVGAQWHRVLLQCSSCFYFFGPLAVQ